MKQDHPTAAALRMEKLSAFIMNKNNRLFLIGLAGICLIFLSDRIFTGKPETAPVTGSEISGDSVGRDTAELEEKLAGLLERVQGAGKVYVMITLESSGETLYACDEKTDAQTDYRNEEGTVHQKNSKQNEHIILDTRQGKEPLVEMYREPEIRGVAVVCEGGDDIKVIKSITELVCVVLKIPSNRICVTKMI